MKLPLQYDELQKKLRISDLRLETNSSHKN
jgi:hypothetical protein